MKERRPGSVIRSRSQASISFRRSKGALVSVAETTDALCVEEAFQARLATLPVNGVDGAETRPTSLQMPPPSPIDRDQQRPNLRRRTKAVDKSELAHPEPRRIRDRDHVRSVSKHPCLICGRQPADAHHLRFAQSRALGRKVSDEFEGIIARFTAAAMRPHGGGMLGWIRPSPPAYCGWGRIPSLPSRTRRRLKAQRSIRPSATLLINDEDLPAPIET